MKLVEAYTVGNNIASYEPDDLEVSPVDELLAGPAATVELTHPTNQAKYKVTKQTYGALSDDPANPLSCVSVANSSLSIDMWAGCTWQCGYCHVHDAEVNHGDEIMKMDDTPRMRTEHTPRAVIDALVKHPFFVPDQTVLSFGTASTEPFDPRVADKVFDLIDELQSQGFRNPLWIVTKNGVPRKVLKRMESCVQKTDKLLLSLTSGGLNASVEPLQNDRFKNAEAAAKMGAKIILYLRPLFELWGSTPEKIREILFKAKASIGGEQFTAIAPGGLRWAEGVEIALLSHGLSWPDELSKDPDTKELPDHIYEYVLGQVAEIFPGTPVVMHSSCAISTALKTADIVSTYSRKTAECLASTCGDEQRERCAEAGGRISDWEEIKKVNSALMDMGIPVFVRAVDGSTPKIYENSQHHMRYATRRTILKVMASLAANN